MFYIIGLPPTWFWKGPTTINESPWVPLMKIAFFTVRFYRWDS